jgi:putative membrane protein
VTTPPAKSSNELAQERTDLADERTSLAVTRTLVALDRTLMAWIRTATSLISFGFTIYKFFQALRQGEGPDTAHLMTPRVIGLVMIALGVGGLILAIVEYRQQVAMLQRKFANYGPFHRSIASAVGTVIAGLGIVGFILVFLRQ